MMKQSVECEMSETGQQQRPGPNRCYQRLVTVLLIWISILTVSQVASITWYFTAGLHTLNPSQEHPIEPIPHEMLIFEVDVHTLEQRKDSVIKDNVTVYWKTQKTASLASLENGILTINKSGCYFLYVQVSLLKKHVMREETTVRVEKQWDNSPGRTVLEGPLFNSTHTTGLLGRVVELSELDKLVVKIDPMVASTINTAETATHMGIYWVAPRPDTDTS